MITLRNASDVVTEIAGSHDSHGVAALLRQRPLHRGVDVLVPLLGQTAQAIARHFLHRFRRCLSSPSTPER